MGPAVSDHRDPGNRPDRARIVRRPGCRSHGTDCLDRGNARIAPRTACCGNRKRVRQGGCLQAHRGFPGSQYRRNTRRSRGSCRSGCMDRPGRSGAARPGKRCTSHLRELGAGKAVLRMAVRQLHPFRNAGIPNCFQRRFHGAYRSGFRFALQLPRTVLAAFRFSDQSGIPYCQYRSRGSLLCVLRRQW